MGDLEASAMKSSVDADSPSYRSTQRRSISLRSEWMLPLMSFAPVVSG